MTGIRTIPLPLQTMAGHQVNRKVVVTWEYVKTLTSAQGQPVIPEQPTVSATATYKTAANTLLKNFLVNVKTAFKGDASDDITLVMDLGLTGGDTDLFTPTEIPLKTAGWTLGLETWTLFATADSVDALITAGVDAITTLTAGEVEIYYFAQELDDLETVGQP